MEVSASIKGDLGAINYWVIPSIKKIKIFKGNPFDANTVKPSFIHFDVKNKAIRISKQASSFMRLEAGIRFYFIAMDELIYCCISDVEGNKLSLATRGDMQTKNAGFLGYIAKNFGAKMPFRCTIKKTKAEFNGNPLFQLEMPYRYNRTFYMNQNKETK